MLADEYGALINEKGMQNEDGFWFGIDMLDENEEYPEPIIDEMKSDRDPIGVAKVRITRDALQKEAERFC